MHISLATLLVTTLIGCMPKTKFSPEQKRATSQKSPSIDSSSHRSQPRNVGQVSSQENANRDTVQGGTSQADANSNPQSEINTNDEIEERIPHPSPVDFSKESLTLMDNRNMNCDSTPNPLRVEHLRLAIHQNPANEIFVNWTTTMEGQRHLVAFDTKSHATDLKYRQALAAQANGPYQEGGEFFHHTKLSELIPDTTYYFMIVSDSFRSKEFQFRTAPTNPMTPLKILGGGDSRSDETMRSKMNTVMRSLLEANPDILGLSHGGDFIASDSYSDWDCWLINHQLTTTADGRVLPVIATQGNHEGSADIFTDIWASPGGKERHYYATKMGSMTLITLNSEISILGDQFNFLQTALMDASKQSTWILASYHTPGNYSGEKGPSDTSEWEPLFNQFAVDIVLESDGHILKKTPPMGNGTIYLGEGGLGVPQRSGSLCDEIAFDYCGSGYHVQMIDVRPEKIEVQIITDAGVADANKTFTIAPKAR